MLTSERKYKFKSRRKNPPSILPRCLYDQEMHDFLSQYKWYERKGWNTFYAFTTITLPNGKKKMVQMHHVIVGRPLGGLITDHINRNGLDNRRENLRTTSNSQNTLNSIRSLKRNLPPNIYKEKNNPRFRVVYNKKHFHGFKTLVEAKEFLKNKEIKHADY